MDIALDRAEWQHAPTGIVVSPERLPAEQGGGALVVAAPPADEPRAPAGKVGARHVIPALLVAGWGGLFAYCATYLREDLPFRPSAPAEDTRRPDDARRKVVVLPDLPPDVAPAAPPAETRLAVAAPVPAPDAIQAVAPTAARRPAQASAEYVGTWGPTPAACLSPTRRRGYLPATISADRARAGRTTCTFHDGHRSGAAWLMAAECSDRGRRWSSQVRLLVEGDRLTWTSNRGTSTYVRCGRRAG
ncbi:peptidase inhibitor family I36 protein [Methylobacterium sp. NFXW15]|uniref:peptidase inhibitor family I36 protein n=1 Tax=Methylobacterium sp. NFXW15 TaxID=2819512 RepID=UPI003CF7D999